MFMHTDVGSKDEIQVVMLPLPTERTILLALAFLFLKNNFSKNRSFIFWISFYFFSFFNVYDISVLRIFPQPKFLYKYLNSLHKFYSSYVPISVYCPLEVDFYAWVKVLFLFLKKWGLFCSVVQ